MRLYGILKTRGAYVGEEGAYKIVMPREAATDHNGRSIAFPQPGLNSWITFSSGVHREAILTGQFLLLADEVNAVLSAALDTTLESLVLRIQRYSQVRICIRWT